jgi:hypothetical protein
MSRAPVILDSPVARQRAARWVQNASSGTSVEFKASKRTLPQNDRMWAMLTELARQLPWHGLSLTPDDWKLIFLDALKREVRAVPNLDGTGFVNIGRSSSDLTKSEMGDLMTIIEEFGARHGVQFHDSEQVAA